MTTTIFTSKCEQCHAEIFPEEETTMKEDQFTGLDLIVCEKCAFKAFKQDRARKQMFRSLFSGIKQDEPTEEEAEENKQK